MAGWEAACDAPRFARQEGGLLAAVFFSDRNLDVLQTKLRFRVYRESGGQTVVNRQSDAALRALMREVYDSSERYAEPDRVLEAVARLDEHVLAQAVPAVLEAARFHEYYLRDTALPNPVPNDRPQLLTSRGTRVLEPFGPGRV